MITQTDCNLCHDTGTLTNPYSREPFPCPVCGERPTIQKAPTTTAANSKPDRKGYLFLTERYPGVATYGRELAVGIAIDATGITISNLITDRSETVPPKGAAEGFMLHLIDMLFEVGEDHRRDDRTTDHGGGHHDG